jgi:ketosteroid isomerase-like protein
MAAALRGSQQNRMAIPMKTLEERIRALEDIERIKQLKARYAAACDNNYDADAIAALFTEDAVWDGGRLGKAGGREAIRKFFSRAAEYFPFAIHNVMNPIIEVDGDQATGQWYLIQPATMAKGNQAVWLAASYNDRYVRIGEDWKFQQLTVTVRFLTPYHEGWASKRFV